MKYQKHFKVIIKTILFLIFPVLYLLVVGHTYFGNDVNMRELYDYLSCFVTFPTCFLIYFISAIFRVNDPYYRFYENLIAGTIQYSFLPFFIFRFYYNRKDFNLREKE
jgi:hypothetical protein